MKYVLILTTLSGLGCALSFYPITQTLAGSVPVGAVSGVTLPSSLGTSNISPVLPTVPISPPTVPIFTPSVPTSAPSAPTSAPTAPTFTPTVPTSTPSTSISAPSTEVSSEKTTPIVPVVNPASQMVLNQTATQTLTELQIIAPTVAGTIVSNISTPPVTLTAPVSQITIAPSAAFTLPSLTTATESVPKDLPTGTLSSPTGEVTLAVTPLQAGQTIATQVGSGRGAEMTINGTALRIPPSSHADNKGISTTATLTIANSQNLNLVLTGTSEQVANAAGFIATAASAGLSPTQIETGISIALTGANFGQVASLINSLSGLMVTGRNQAIKPKLDQPILVADGITNDRLTTQGKSEVKHGPVEDVSIEPIRLSTAIVVFNQIIDTSSDATVIALSENSEFLTIGKMLQRLRSAFDD
ncbi:hypothetical protein GSN00_01845 [Cylindrospermopsis raciborskii CHAB3438]|uniref:hypothetical protein n=1 Tax=Cylindrospermopsis raciborskii TaxID=77022 RepID=UPI001F0F46AB|nr:hypothetical protein [Cylindrospermopsis raciborskii]MCH4903156.1 hypothetical protein [Cylindrospermopsis raciborskii CHAB3438]MEB3145039.1 hypothetical protein [Cylindrospermopsis raciborskii]